MASGMIDLATEMVPSGAEIELLDFGFLQRPSSGAPAVRVSRPGSRFRVALSFPPMTEQIARRVLPRLKRAKREGLRVRWPVGRGGQGFPGNPVVDGNGQAGTSLEVRGLTPGYAAGIGYVLHIEEGATGERCIHELQQTTIAGGDGKAVFDIEPPLRLPFADGDTIELAAPTIEGWPLTETVQSLSVDRLVRGVVIELEEMA